MYNTYMIRCAYYSIYTAPTVKHAPAWYFEHTVTVTVTVV